MGNQTSSVTENFNRNVSESITQQMTNITRSSSGAISGSQVLKFKNITCGGDFVVRGIQQKMVVKYNFSRIAQVVNQTELKRMLQNAVENAVQKDQNVKAEFLSFGASTADQTRNYQENVSRVVNSYSHNDLTNDIMTAQAQQEIGFDTIEAGGNCDFSNISQEVHLEVIIKNMSSNMTAMFQQIVEENKTKSTTETSQTVESTGLFGDVGRAVGGIVDSLGGLVGSAFAVPVLIIVGFIMFLVLIGIVMKVFMSGSSEMPAEQPVIDEFVQVE